MRSCTCVDCAAQPFMLVCGHLCSPICHASAAAASRLSFIQPIEQQLCILEPYVCLVQTALKTICCRLMSYVNLHCSRQLPARASFRTIRRPFFAPIDSIMMYQLCHSPHFIPCAISDAGQSLAHAQTNFHVVMLNLTVQHAFVHCKMNRKMNHKMNCEMQASDLQDILMEWQTERAVTEHSPLCAAMPTAELQDMVCSQDASNKNEPVVVVKGVVYLTRQDLCSLRVDEWIPDSIINAYNVFLQVSRSG